MLTRFGLRARSCISWSRLWRWRVVRGAAIVAFTVLAAANTRGQLIVGVDDSREGLWDLNPANNQVSTFLPNFAANAMATDEVNQVLYFMPNTVQLWRWDYGTSGAVPQFIANTTSATSGTGFISLTGLAFDSSTNRLFASRSLDSTAGPEGFYEVNTTTGFSTLRIATTASQYDWGGLDHDASTGRFFANSDPGVSGTSTPGIFEINFTSNTFASFGPYPGSTTVNPGDIDGLAAGDGKIYLVEDRAVQVGGKIYVFNTTTMQYETPLMVPWFFNEVFAGATYSPTLAAAMAAIVPEPTAAAAALLAGGALMSRRRNRRRSAARATVAAAAGVLAVGAVTRTADAQLVMASGTLNQGLYLGNLATLRPTDQYPLPANIIDWQQVFVGRNIRGMAADDTNRMLYWLDLNSLGGGLPASTLYRMSYDTLAPELVGVVRNQSSGFEQSFMGLAIDPATQRMYATYNIGGTPGEGVYEIDYLNPTPGPNVLATPRLLYNTLPGGETAYDFKNLDFDPLTNTLYGVNDDSDQQGRGLYSFNLTAGTISKIVSSPDYRRIENDFDGLATGGGKAYFTTDEPGFVYVYDIVANTGQFTDFLSPVLTDDGLFGGAAYAPGMIPEPTSAGAVVTLIASGALGRKRRSGAGRT